MGRLLECENGSTADQVQDEGQTEFENKHRSFAMRIFEPTCSKGRKVLRALADRQN